jgi:hypothetical protein
MRRIRTAWLDALALGLTGVALSLLLLGLVAVPQRRAQRPRGDGVLTLHLTADGGLRVWNHRLREGDLALVLHAAGRQLGSAPRLRLIPAASVPWGMVRERLDSLAASGQAVELQLP